MGLFDRFGKKETETTDVSNDMERWATDTYALWSEYAGGSFRQIGGYQKNRADASMMRGVLRRDWGIANEQELLEMIVDLLRVDIHKKKESDAWDYCRAAQLAGMGYIAGYFTREVLLNCSAVAGRVMQLNYSGWEELCESYLTGHAEWCRESFDKDQAEKTIAERRDIYKRLCSMPDGPYRVDWNLNMEEWLKGAEPVYQIVMGKE